MYLCLLTLVRPFFYFFWPWDPRSSPFVISKPLILRLPKLDKIMYSSFTTSKHNVIPLMRESDVTMTSYKWIHWQKLQNFPQSRHEKYQNSMASVNCLRCSSLIPLMVKQLIDLFKKKKTFEQLIYIDLEITPSKRDPWILRNSGFHWFSPQCFESVLFAISQGKIVSPMRNWRQVMQIFLRKNRARRSCWWSTLEKRDLISYNIKNKKRKVQRLIAMLIATRIYLLVCRFKKAIHVGDICQWWWC